jgi:Flp pilus assembly protein CpaB
MRSRGLVVAVAVVLAVVAAAAVILYTNGVKNDAVTGGALSIVVVPKQEIPANTNLNPLIDQGVFSELQVPTDAVVDGAVTNVSQLRGQTTTAPILANEQIPAARLSSGEAPSGGALGITEGHVAVSISMDVDEAVAGTLSAGDNVAVYATFDQDTPVRALPMKQLLSGAQLQRFYEALQGGGSSSGKPPVVGLPDDYTVVLVPSVRILQVQNPVVNEDGRASSQTVLLTLDLLPEDSDNLVLASEKYNVWLGALPPENPDGYKPEGTFGPSYESVIGSAK